MILIRNNYVIFGRGHTSSNSLNFLEFFRKNIYVFVKLISGILISHVKNRLIKWHRQSIWNSSMPITDVWWLLLFCLTLIECKCRYYTYNILAYNANLDFWYQNRATDNEIVPLYFTYISEYNNYRLIFHAPLLP